MANGEFIEVLSPSALKNLEALNAELLKTVANVKNVNQNMISIKTPSGSESAIKSLNDQLLKQDEIIKKLQSDYIKLAQTRQAIIVQNNSMASSATKQTNGTRDQAVAQQILRAETDRNFRANTLLAGAYAKASAQLLILKKEAKDAAIAFGEESVQAQIASKAALDMDARIKSADKSAGDFQRNVGNYSNGVTKGIAGAFSGLRQLAYILPGLGIAGIFNIAFDAILPLIQQIDIFNKKLDVTVETRKALNDITIESNKNAVQETITLQGNLKTARDANLPLEERLIAVQNLQDTYPFYFENLTKEQILAGQTAEAEKALTDAILSRAMANAAIGKITENEGKIIEIELQRIEAQKQIKILNEQIEVTEKNLQKAGNITNSQGIALSQMYERRNSIVKDWMKLTKSQNEIQAINNTLTTFATTKQEEAIGLDYKKEKVQKGANRDKLEAIELNKKENDQRNALISKLEEEINIHKKLRDEAATNIDQYRQFDEVVRSLSNALDLVKNPDKYMNKDVSGLKSQQDAIQKHKEGIEALDKAMANYAQGFQDTFVNNAGFKTTFDILNGNIIGFGSNVAVTALAVTESFQEMFNFISKMSQENFDSQREQLKQETEIKLAFAGDSQTAQDEIKRQAAEKERQIRIREFNAKKQEAKFNIAIDLAQAVMATFANVGFPAGIPLAAIMTAIGLAQIAAVNAQEVPAFYKGTENAPNGWAWTQERGQELILDKNNKVKSYGNDKGAQLTKLDAGDKVKTAEETKRILSSSLIFDNQLNNIMANNGISSPIVVQNNMDFKEDLNRVGSNIVSAIQNKTEYSGIFDKNGIRVFARNAHATKEILNSQVTFGR